MIMMGMMRDYRQGRRTAATFTTNQARGPDAEFAIPPGALIMRTLPLVVKKLGARDGRLPVTQRLVERLEDAMTFRLAITEQYATDIVAVVPSQRLRKGHRHIRNGRYVPDVFLVWLSVFFHHCPRYFAMRNTRFIWHPTAPRCYH